jgi:hypothetical protein
MEAIKSDTANVPVVAEPEKANMPAVAESSTAVTAINSYLAETDPQATVGKLIKFTKGEFLKGMDLEVVPDGSTFCMACDLTLRGPLEG